MIIKAIQHDTKKHTKQRTNDLHQSSYTKSATHHPFLKEREYVRALNAAKLDRLFAKPFIRAFSEHQEGVTRVARHSNKDLFVTASFDGATNVYDCNGRNGSCLATIKHADCAKGIAFYNDNLVVSNRNHFYLYDFESICEGNIDDNDNNCDINLHNSYFNTSNNISNNKLKEKSCTKVDGFINYISVSKGNNEHSNGILVSSTNGLYSYKNLISEKYLSHSCEFATFDYNNTLIGATSNRSVLLYDIRAEKEVFNSEIGAKTNFIAFSPINQMNYFATANEDQNVYYHDLRYLSNPVGTFIHHVNAVTGVDFHPTRPEIVTCSSDKTIRIFKTNERKSRDVYYNKRMQGVNAVCYSVDGKFIVSGSDDGSVRLWRSDASEKENMKIGEVYARNGRKALMEKYKDVNEVGKVMKHRFLPKDIKAEMRNKNEHYKATERRRREYTKHNLDDLE
ncbi:Protein sof1 [Conglomerata obtusa]